MAAAVRFLFDFVSPYAYLAWQRIHAIVEPHGCAVEPVPVLFAGLLGAHGQKGPAEVPARRRYVYVDCVRLAHAHGIPFGLPPAHPFNPLHALRTVGIAPPEVQRRLIDALFDEVWGERRGGIDSGVGIARAAGHVGLPAMDLVVAGTTPEAKARLRAATEDAIAAGVFGVPTMLVDGAMFWGNDALPHLDRFLAGDDPLAGQDLTRWEHLPAAATRKEAT